MSSLLEDSIIDAIHNYSSFFFNKKNVLGVGLGFKSINSINTFEPSLHILVDKKTSLNKLYKNDIIPSNFFGIKTDVIGIGPVSSKCNKNSLKSISSYSPYFSYNNFYLNNSYYHQSPFVNFNKVNNNLPLIIGSSIGPSTIRDVGTLGAFVFGNHDNYPYILSNNHVLAGSNKITPGTPIVYPGRADRFDGRNIARLTRSIMLYFDSPYFNPKNTVDCAIAKLNENLLYDLNIPGIGIIKETTLAQVGNPITKVGRTTGQTFGTIQTTHAQIKVDMEEDGVCTFYNTICANLLSRPGDSGSLGVDTYNKKALGLVYAASPNQTFLCPINSVLRNLNVHFEY